MKFLFYLLVFDKECNHKSWPEFALEVTLQTQT